MSGLRAYVDAVTMMQRTKPALRVDWGTHQAAAYACQHWHYSATTPPPPRTILGVWEDGVFVGVVIFSRGAARHIGTAYGLAQTEIVELSRVALRSHHAPVSRIVSIAVRMLKAQAPGLRLLVSYADPAHGHNGSIYQAMGWTYVGPSASTVSYLGPDGKRWHSRMVSPSGVKKVYGVYRRVYTPDQCTVLRETGKHKYLYPLDEAMRRQIAPLAKSYPKRAGSIVADAPSDQDGEGGAEPTPALHMNDDDDGGGE